MATMLEKLKAFWLERREQVNAAHKRTLLFGDYVVDRWKRARTLGFGEGTSVYDSVLVFGDVEVGMNTWIGPFVILDGSGGLKIGSNCSISSGVQIYSHDSVKWATSGGKSPYDLATTEIGNNCYIGPKYSREGRSYWCTLCNWRKQSGAIRCTGRLKSRCVAVQRIGNI
jgi:acetyltransferase-like isoleucine patch superfamily enzyme